MSAENHSLDLQVVVGEEIKGTIETRPFVRDQAVVMLRSVLEVFGARGRWVYMMLGFGTLPNPSQYWMEVSAASENVSLNMVHVIIRSSTVSQGTLMGMLKLPGGVERKEFLDTVKLAIDRFNGSGWHGIVEREKRTSMQVGSQGLSPQIRRALIEGDDDPSLRRAVPRPTPIDGQTALALARGETVRVGGGRLRQDPTSRPPDRTQSVGRSSSARSAIQPGIGAELAAKSEGAFWVSPRPAGVTFPISSEKKGPIMDQGATTSQAVVISGGEGHASDTVRRARAMLVFLLNQVGLSPGEGCWFEITGSAETLLRDQKKPHVTLSGDGDSSVIRVALRSRGTRDGTLSGRWHLPEGVDRNEFLTVLSQTAGNFNDHDGWYEAFEIPVGGVEEPILVGAGASSPKPDQPASLSAQKSLLADPPPLQGDTHMATNRPLEDEAKLVQFLITALQLPEVENGIISTGMVAKLIEERFKPANPKTFAGPLFAKLKSLGHVLHVGYGLFQVTELFIKAHKLGIEIKVRPEYHKGDASAKKPSRGGNGAHHELTLVELLQNRQAMETMIHQTAVREHKALKQSIADLQAQLEAAQSALSAFETEHAALLGAEVVSAHALAATGTRTDHPH